MTNGEQALTEEYKKLTSPKSVEETGRILLSLGKEIESRFPGVKFYLKARFKSPHSFREKVKKLKDNDQNDEKTIYDMIGFRLVIENVENDFQFSQKRCKNLVEKKKKIMDELSKLETQKAKYINDAGNIAHNREEKRKLLNSNEKNLERIQKQIQSLQEHGNEGNSELLELLCSQEDLTRKNINSLRADILDIRSRINERLESYKQYLEIVKMKKKKLQHLIAVLM